MVMAVERNNQARQIIYSQDLNQNFTNNGQKRRKKQSINIRDEFHFSEIHGSMNATGPVQS